MVYSIIFPINTSVVVVVIANIIRVFIRIMLTFTIAIINRAQYKKGDFKKVIITIIFTIIIPINIFVTNTIVIVIDNSNYDFHYNYTITRRLLAESSI